jgi:transposase
MSLVLPEPAPKRSLDALSLDELATTANREHNLALQAGAAMVEHAILSGEALLAAKQLVPHGEWLFWLHDNFTDGSRNTAYRFMRLARHKGIVREHQLKDIHTAETFLLGAPDSRLAQFEPAEARLLRDQGMTYKEIGDRLQVSETTAWHWCNPKASERIKAKHRVTRQSDRQKLKQHRRQLMMRKVGGDLRKSWQQVRLALDILEKEQTKPGFGLEAKQAIQSAMHSLYNAEDKLVLAGKLSRTHKSPASDP